MITCGVLFFASYGFSSWVAAQRRHVPSIVFGWEHSIPFLAWTIVPYWSTDFFYLLSFFLCKTEKEQASHVRRLLTAQIISVVVFLVFPLQFSFHRPHTAGVFGLMFQALGSFDGPLNQAPSLHVSLLTILWAKYSDHLHDFWLLLVRVWFVISGLSTLTTYQHHFIDLPTGLWVGLLCIALFPLHRVPHVRAVTSMKLACAYLAGSVCLIIAACRLSGLAWLLLWPAGALLMVAVVYGTGSVHLLRNEKGKMGWAVAILLAPYLTAAWLNSRCWTYGEPVAHELVPGIWLGRLPDAVERRRLRLGSIVNLAPELAHCDRGIEYTEVPVLDLTIPTPSDLDAAVKAIEKFSTSRPTLICCALGYSRSAMAAAAWLVASHRARSVRSAIALVRRRRQGIVLSAVHCARLEEWAAARSDHEM